LKGDERITKTPVSSMQKGEADLKVIIKNFKKELQTPKNGV
jgi:hypothetical protein